MEPFPPSIELTIIIIALHPFQNVGNLTSFSFYRLLLFFFWGKERGRSDSYAWIWLTSFLGTGGRPVPIERTEDRLAAVLDSSVFCPSLSVNDVI